MLQLFDECFMIEEIFNIKAMIIYNVTINVEDEIAADWLQWMKETHLPDVMKTGMFEYYKFLKLHTRQEDEVGQTFAVQYYASHMDNYEKYVNEYAPALKADSFNRWGNKFIAFRTLLEELD
jgi:hypothetical protein